LGGHEGCFFSTGVTKDSFDVLVTALMGFPMRVSKGLLQGVDIQLIDEL
jgi:hypothetical protein